MEDDKTWEEETWEALKEAFEPPPEQKPIFKGSMIYRTKEWFKKNGLKWPD